MGSYSDQVKESVALSLIKYECETRIAVTYLLTCVAREILTGFSCLISDHKCEEVEILPWSANALLKIATKTTTNRHPMMLDKSVTCV